MRALRGRVSGLCQPAYVLDIPGGHGKAVIGSDSIRETGGCRRTVSDFRASIPILPWSEEHNEQRGTKVRSHPVVRPQTCSEGWLIIHCKARWHFPLPLGEGIKGGGVGA